MLHKIFDFTQTILASFAFLAVIAFSIITVNALNPTVYKQSQSNAQVAGITTITQDKSIYPVQFMNVIQDPSIDSRLSLENDHKSSMVVNFSNLSKEITTDFITIQNLNSEPVFINISATVAGFLNNNLQLKVINGVAENQILDTNYQIRLEPMEYKKLSLNVSSTSPINFPFEVNVELVQ